MGEMRNTCRILARRLEETRPLERPARRSEDSIKVNLKKLNKTVLLDSPGSE
jgi:hypothetical protein